MASTHARLVRSENREISRKNGKTVVLLACIGYDNESGTGLT